MWTMSRLLPAAPEWDRIGRHGAGAFGALILLLDVKGFLVTERAGSMPVRVEGDVVVDILLRALLDARERLGAAECFGRLFVGRADGLIQIG